MNANPKQLSEKKLTVSIATSPEEINQCLQLRYKVFAEEMGAQLNPHKTSPANTLDPQATIPIDKDRFDDHCAHLMVIDLHPRELAATTRVLSDAHIRCTGSYYSATEFNLENILKLPGNFLEVGRTCIHRDYRRGSAIALLWQGIASLVAIHQTDYLIGCASIPLKGGHHYVNAVMRYLRQHHFSEPSLRATPLIPLPQCASPAMSDVIPPPLLRAYLRQGAQICGEAYWDSAFGAADVLVMLDCNKIANRYNRHFLKHKRA